MIRFNPLTGGRSARWAGRSLGLMVLAALFVLMCASPAGAQLAGKGAIYGTVTDNSGAMIPGATVSATNNGNGITSTTVSTASGDFRFPNLDPGIYTVVTTMRGFQKLSQQNIHVNAMETAAYNAVLQIGAESQEITVTAEPPQIETTNATLGATMEQETYSELPVQMGAYGQADQRRATDFVYLMPGVQGNVTNGNATTNTGVVNGSGGRGAVSSVYIDGIPFVRAGGQGDPRYVWTAISVDAVDQFQLQTTGYSAVYEGQGVMNYSIKQGKSNLHGSVYEFFRNTALDTWGFWGKVPNAATGVPVKPVEHSNEYGINLGGPLIPIGSLKTKLFFFTNYNGFRYTSQNPTPMTFPTAAMQKGDFSGTGVNIYDPNTGGNCTTSGSTTTCRTQFSGNMIPQNRLSPYALNMQSFMSQIPASAISNATQNNYIASNATGLNNWSTTSRIDYVLTPKDTLSAIGAVGRQASSVPVGQTTAGRNVGPVPYNYGQAYAPKTAVWTVEETHVFSSNLINQFKYGYARYNGPTFNPADNPAYAATKMGITGLPVGQAANSFPIVNFTGTAAPTNWNGANENRTIAQNYTLLDNVQWNVGKHSFTFGGQIAWMLYNVLNATGGSTQITLANAQTETAQLSNGTAKSGTGLAYASFLLGQIDKGSFTQYLVQVNGSRFRAISPYVQDNWKVTNKLTLDLGLRYDFFPTLTEVHNAMSYFDPNLPNPVTGLKGALQFTGSGTGTCNCNTPVNNYFKNFGPRVGLAYQLDDKTVIRASYGVMFTHGNAVGGLNYAKGDLGFSSAPSFGVTGSQTTSMTGLLVTGNGAIPAYTTATGVASGPAYGTGFTNTTGFTGTPSSMNYNDPYYGGRAPEFLNWSFGLQRQLTNKLAFTATYVGSQGHFLQADSKNGRGYWSNSLDPKYMLQLGSHLADKGNTIATDCATYSLPCPPNAIMNTGQQLSTYLKPFPFQGVTDNFGQYMANSNYHALQVLLNMRAWHGLTTNVNYTWSKAIDDTGYFRTGYAIPAGVIDGSSASYAANRIDRGASMINQPHHFVVTSVWNMPFGKTVFASSSVERAILGGYTFSGVFQDYSGSPLMITSSSCNANPSLPDSSNFCPPSLNPAFNGSARINGKWGDGVTAANPTAVKFINQSAFAAVPDYKIGNSPRTAAQGLYGPGNYQLDLALVRSFPLHITEQTAFKFRAEWYNVTNHTLFAVASSAWSSTNANAAFGTVTSNAAANRKAFQFSGRIEF